MNYNKVHLVEDPRVVIFEIPESALDDGADGHNWAGEYYEDEYFRVLEDEYFTEIRLCLKKSKSK